MQFVSCPVWHCSVHCFDNFIVLLTYMLVEMIEMATYEAQRMSITKHRGYVKTKED